MSASRGGWRSPVAGAVALAVMSVVAGMAGKVPAADGPAVLDSVRLSKTHTPGCLNVMGTVTLTVAAPSGGAEVALASDSAHVSVPAAVTVKEGTTSKTFRVVTSAVVGPEVATIGARTASSHLSAVLTLEPIPPRSVTLAPDNVIGGTSVAGTLALPCPAGPGDIVVALTSSKPTVATPATSSVTVPAGSKVAAFAVTTAASAVTTQARISGTANGVTKSTALIVGPTIAFEEVAGRAGIVWQGRAGHEAFSLAWTDFDSNGLPDLWSMPHGTNFNGSRYPLLYINQGDGRFVNRFERSWLLGNGGDTHGSSWADVDNDGDPDVFVSVGAHQGTGTGDKILYVNDGGVLRDAAASRGLDYPFGRGRGSLWFDWNLDGLLDLIQGVAPRPDGLAPTALFVQTSGGVFEDRTGTAGPLGDDEARIVQLADLSGDGRLDVLVCEQCAVSAEHTLPSHLRIFESAGTALREITGLVLPPISAEPKHTRDVVIADVNNDLHTDVLLSRSTTGYPGSTVFQGSAQLATADLVVQSRELGVSFRSTGSVYFDLIGEETTVLPSSSVFIGAEGRSPSAIGFTLGASDPGVAGLTPHVAGVDRGLYIGYDPGARVWQARFSSPGSEILRLIVSATGGITDLTRLGFVQADISRNALPPLLLMFDAAKGRYVDRTAGSGLEAPVLGQSAVAGDFDNDMDVDLYFSGEHRSFHDANVLYTNRGNGTFVAAPLAGNARGRAVGPCALEYGLAARLAVADYDVDGFLDIFSGTTNAMTPTRTFLGEPPQLFHNLGNGNHWIEIDLVGVISNRDAVGARVTVTAAGRTQLREQGGGMHHFAQDHRRLHFGLGANRRVQRLEVRWPSGLTQVLTDLPADQVLRVTEPSVAP